MSTTFGGPGVLGHARKQLDFFREPKDLRRGKGEASNRGKDLRTKKGVKGWASWIPRSEVENIKFQELVLCPKGDRTKIPRDERDGLGVLQERLEGGSSGRGQGHHDSRTEQEQVHRSGRDLGDCGRGGEMQGPNEKEAVAKRAREA